MHFDTLFQFVKKGANCKAAEAMRNFGKPKLHRFSYLAKLPPIYTQCPNTFRTLKIVDISVVLKSQNFEWKIHIFLRDKKIEGWTNPLEEPGSDKRKINRVNRGW